MRSMWFWFLFTESTWSPQPYYDDNPDLQYIGRLVGHGATSFLPKIKEMFSFSFFCPLQTDWLSLEPKPSDNSQILPMARNAHSLQTLLVHSGRRFVDGFVQFLWLLLLSSILWWWGLYRNSILLSLESSTIRSVVSIHGDHRYIWHLSICFDSFADRKWRWIHFAPNGHGYGLRNFQHHQRHHIVWSQWARPWIQWFMYSIIKLPIWLRLVRWHFFCTVFQK